MIVKKTKELKSNFTWKNKHKIIMVEIKIKFSSNNSSPT